MSPAELPHPPGARASGAASRLLPADGRDYRADFWRGVALLMIFVNHMPGNDWAALTSTRFGFSDAAEIFVFLAGYASAYAYGRPFLAGRRLLTVVKAWRRAGFLLLVHWTLTIFALGLFSYGALLTGRGEFLQANALWTISWKPIEMFVGMMTLGHQFGFVNILPMYAAILVMLPAHLLLAAAFGRRGMLLAAAALWIACGVWRFNVPAFPFEGGWYFDPFAWQFLFAIGLFCGMRRIETGRAVGFSAPLFLAAVLYLLAALATVKTAVWDVWFMNPLPFVFSAFDKTFLTAPRLLHVLAMAYVAAKLMRHVPALMPGRANVMTTIGRHSLPVFALGTVLSISGQMVLAVRPPSILLDTVMTLGGLLLMWGLARHLDWWRRVTREPAAPAAESRAAAEGTARPEASIAG